MEEKVELGCPDSLKKEIDYGFRNCLVIYETTEKVKYDAEGKIVNKQSITTARKVDL